MSLQCTFRLSVVCWSSPKQRSPSFLRFRDPSCRKHSAYRYRCTLRERPLQREASDQSIWHAVASSKMPSPKCFTSCLRPVVPGATTFALQHVSVRRAPKVPLTSLAMTSQSSTGIPSAVISLPPAVVASKAKPKVTHERIGQHTWSRWICHTRSPLSSPEFACQRWGFVFRV